MRTLILTALLLALPARAEVIFIDMNNSPKEIEAAQAAAIKSKREFVVFPSFEDTPMKVRVQLAGLRSEAERTQTQFKNKKCAAPLNPECEKLAAKFTELEKSKKELLQKHKFDRDKFARFLADREKSGKTLSTLVVSGHDGTGIFAGDFGRIGDHELAEIFNQYAPASKDTITSLHLWGCYTTSPGSLLLNWKKYFPQAVLISGYDDRAPLNDKPAGWNYLKGVIAREPTLVKIRDHAKLRKELRAIPGATDVFAGINVCDAYANHKESYDLSELGAKCADLKTQLEAKQEEYLCYFRAKDDQCADPPKDTGAGAVRKFYQILQKSAACSAVSQDTIFTQFPRESGILLVYFKEVQKNFARIYGSELEESDEMLKSLGAPEQLRFANLDKLSRKELVARMEQLQDFLNKREIKIDEYAHPRDVTVPDDLIKAVTLSNLHSTLTAILYELRPGCTPFNWTEPHRDDPSPCIDKNNLGHKGMVSMMKYAPAFKRNVLNNMIMKLGRRIDAERREGRGRPEVVAARGQLFTAMAHRIGAHADHGDGSQQAKEWEGMVNWAEAALKAAKAGHIEPNHSDEAVRVVIDGNLDTVREAIKQADGKAQVMTDQLRFDETAAVKQHLAELRARIFRQAQIAQELRKKETGGTALSEEESARKRAAELEVGKLLAERDIFAYREKIKKLEKLKKESSKELQAFYDSSIHQDQSEVKKLESKKEPDLRRLAEDFLYLPGYLRSREYIQKALSN